MTTTDAGGRGFLPSLEGLRAVAALLVLVTHVSSAAGAQHLPVIGVAMARGTWGVTLFFILSGFLLSRPFVRTRLDGTPAPHLGRYALLRTARILPAYWLVLVAVLLTTAAGSSAGVIVSNVTLTQTYTGAMLEGYFQTWSLCTEVAFYVVLPLLIPLVIRRTTRATLIALAVMAAVTFPYLWWVKATDFFGYAAVWLPGHLDWFAAGIGLAVAEPWLRGRRALPRPWGRLASPAPWWVVGAAAWLLMLTPLGGAIGFGNATTLQALTSELLFGIAGLGVLGALLVGLRQPQWPGRLLATAPALWAGRISYSIFLWQLVVIALVRDRLDLPFGGGGFLVTLVVAGAVTIAASQVSWLVLERPVLRWAHGRASRIVDLRSRSHISVGEGA